MRTFRQSLCLFTVLLASPLVWSAELRTDHTYALKADETRPEATIEDAEWLVGSWTGSAFGQQFEQVWNAPSAGTMIGLFKLYGDEGVSFYELLELSVEDGTLSLKVKHFSADFTAWESKEDYVIFRLVMKDDDALHFGGLSFYRRGDNSIDGYIVMRDGEELTEHPLQYQRRQ